MKANFVAKHLHKSCKPSIVPSKHRELKTKAQHREQLETLSESEIDPLKLKLEEEE